MTNKSSKDRVSWLINAIKFYLINDQENGDKSDFDAETGLEKVLQHSLNINGNLATNYSADQNDDTILLDDDDSKAPIAKQDTFAADRKRPHDDQWQTFTFNAIVILGVLAGVGWIGFLCYCVFNAVTR